MIERAEINQEEYMIETIRYWYDWLQPIRVTLVMLDIFHNVLFSFGFLPFHFKHLSYAAYIFYSIFELSILKKEQKKIPNDPPMPEVTLVTLSQEPKSENEVPLGQIKLVRENGLVTAYWSKIASRKTLRSSLVELFVKSHEKDRIILCNQIFKEEEIFLPEELKKTNNVELKNVNAIIKKYHEDTVDLSKVRKAFLRALINFYWSIGNLAPFLMTTLGVGGMPAIGMLCFFGAATLDFIMDMIKWHLIIKEFNAEKTRLENELNLIRETLQLHKIPFVDNPKLNSKCKELKTLIQKTTQTHYDKIKMILIDLFLMCCCFLLIGLATMVFASSAITGPMGFLVAGALGIFTWTIYERCIKVKEEIEVAKEVKAQHVQQAPDVSSTLESKSALSVTKTKDITVNAKLYEILASNAKQTREGMTQEKELDLSKQAFHHPPIREETDHWPNLVSLLEPETFQEIEYKKIPGC